MRGARCRLNPLLRRVGARTPWSPFLVVEDGPAEGLLVRLDRASADYSLGDNEPAVQAALVEHLRPGGVFYDVGANVGFFSLLARRLVGPTGRVCAFEPVEAIARAARRNLDRNGMHDVVVVQAAVGRESGHASIDVFDHPGGGSLAQGTYADPVAGRFEVPVVALDYLAGGPLPVPTVVKIDVEGYEEEVIAGMATTLRRHRPTVVCEVDAPTAPELARRADRIARALSSFDYRVEDPRPAYLHTAWKVAHLVADPLRVRVAP